MTHVDDFIDDIHSHPYASWVLDYFRRPAMHQARWRDFMAEHKLFCTYKHARYRCTGASRLGDLWLSRDFKRDIGYDVRVNVDDCSAWGPKP